MGVSDTAGPALMSEPTGVEGHGRTGHLPRFCCAQVGNGPRDVLRLDKPPDCIASQQHLVEHLRLAQTMYTGLVRMARQRRRVAVAAAREIPYPVSATGSERDSNPRCRLTRYTAFPGLGREVQARAQAGTPYSDFSSCGHHEAGEGTPVGTPLGLDLRAQRPAMERYSHLRSPDARMSEPD
jgi:hypothetical protein